MTKKTNHGQGLIEALIILLFIGVSIAAILKFQNYLSYSTSLTQQLGNAALIATNQIETLRNFTVINTTSGYTAYQDIATGSGSTTVSGTSYTISWTITSFVNPTYKTLDVTVSWTDRYNTAQSVRLTTQVAGIDPSASAFFM